jgi:cytoskeleton protein RodZ
MIDTDTPHLEPELDNARRMLPLAKFASCREELGLTLSDVFARTRITVRNLTALEEEDFASLPASVYTRSFIRQYAKLLNIDPDHALREYDDYLQSVGEMIVVAEKLKAEDIHQKGFLQIKIKTKKSSRVLFLSIILAVVFFGFIVFLLESNTTHFNAIDQQAVKNLFPSQEILVSEEEEEAAQKSLAEVMAAIPASGPLELTIKARETTWISVRVDNQGRGHETTLYAGGMATFTGNRFLVNIGNAGGTDVFLQGNLLPSLGKKGEAVRIILPPKDR